jgi:CHAD domain-containing protein
LTKRARYVAEALVPVIGKDAARFASRASDLQDILGELQDATVAGEWLKAFAASSPQSAFVAGKLAGMETIAGRMAFGQWRDAWKELDRKKVTAWLSA